MTSFSIEEGTIDLTVVITCYNEGAFIVDTIGHVVQALKATALSYEVIVVDDVSCDDSVQRIKGYLASHPDHPVRLVQNMGNRGRVRIYFETAPMGRGKYYRLCCGDDSEPLEALVNIFQCTGAADVVVPFQDDHQIAGKSRWRMWISRTFTFLVNLMGGYHLNYYNGMAIHRRSNVTRWPPDSFGFGYEADLLVRVLDEGATFVQVRRASRDRKGGTSNPVNFRNTLSVGRMLVGMAIRRLRRALCGTKRKPIEIVLGVKNGDSTSQRLPSTRSPQ